MIVTHHNAHVWNLPVETTCHILSLCRDDSDGYVDRSTLSSCSLVSKEWNSIVLPLLFSDLRIAFRSRFLQAEDEDEGTINMGLSENTHVSDIPTLLQETAQRILPLVKKLHLVVEMGDQTDLDYNDDEAIQDLVKPRDLCDIVRLFPSLKALELENIILCMPPVTGSGLQHLALDELYIKMSEWATNEGPQYAFCCKSPRNHLWMLRVFGSVQQLILHGIKEDWGIGKYADVIFDTLVGSSLRIKALKVVEAKPLDAFMNAFRRDPSVIANLDSLDLVDDIYPIDNFYEDLPKGLSHLGLSVSFLEDCTTPLGIVHFMTSPKMADLRSLTFHELYWSSIRGWPDEDIDLVARILEAMAGAQLCQLECVTLAMLAPQHAGCGLDWNSELPAKPLAAFATIQDAILRMPTLKTLVIDNCWIPGQGVPLPWTVDMITPSVRASYQRLFPVLHAKGKLQILPTKDRIVEAAT